MSPHVLVTPPDPHWPQAYLAEATRLSAALGEEGLAFHHMGSTAIPGIHAKPVIDMLLVVRSLAGLDERSAELVALGYEAKGEFGIPGRRYFRRDDAQGVRTHQLHAFTQGSPEIARHLAFRDYLRAHPAAAQAYSALKQSLAAQHPKDMAAYVAGKDAFIKAHQALGLASEAVEGGATVPLPQHRPAG